MGFKLGANRGNYATGGEIKTQMRFGKQAGDIGSVPGTPVIRVPLDEGIMGEANMDGSIFVNEKIVPGSYVDQQVITHEMRHATDIKVGKLSYADNHIMYNGERFDRETINGLDMIKVDGKWKEAGDTGMPWEVDANNGGNGDI
jgi:hypothetical protein